MKRQRPTFAHACAVYVHRYTMEHKPAWARGVRSDGLFYAPHYSSDLEWYDNTSFPGEGNHIGRITSCFSRNASWPLGQSLTKEFFTS